MNARSSTALRTSFAYFAILSASLFWAGNGLGSKILYRPDGAHFDAIGLFVARAAWSLPVFVLLALATRPKHGVTRSDWWALIAIGVAFGPGACGFLALGAQYTSGAHIVLLMSLSPPLTAVIAALVLRERVERLRVIALALGIVGALLLTMTRSATGSSLKGDLLELVQVVSLAVMFVSTRYLGTRYSPLFVSGVYGTVGMGILAAYGAAIGRLVPSILQPLTPDHGTWGWFFGEIVIGLSIYGQAAQSYALRTLGAGTVSLIASYTTLVLGIAGAIVLLGEQISPAGILAGILLAVALGLALVPTRRNETPVIPPATGEG